MPSVRSRKRGIPNVQNKYDAAGSGRRLAGWNPGTSGPNRAIQGLQKIRDRARDASRNDWSGASAVQKWSTNLVGVGITPRWENTKFGPLWAEHVPTADADGVLDAYGMQTLGVRSWFDSGEVFLRRRPRDLSAPLSAPVQYQLIESDYCPLFDATSWPGMPEGNTIRQGIERNKYGRRTAYWMYKEHPNDAGSGPDPMRLIRIPASEIRHMFEPVRPGQLRGVSGLSSVLVRLRATADFEDAVLDRQKLANLFVAFITRTMPELSADDFDPDTGLPKFYDKTGTPMVGLEPGTTQEMQPGEKVEFANPPEAGTTYSDYLRTTGVGTAAGAGLPYEIHSGDIKDVSDRTLRVVINEFRRFARQRQWQIVIPMLCQPMVEWWADALLLKGDISFAELKAAKTPKWSPEGWEYIHPTQDAEGKKTLIEIGVASRDEIIAERGNDPREVDAERAAAKKREDNLGLTPPPEPAKPAAPAKPTAKAELEDRLAIVALERLAAPVPAPAATAPEGPTALEQMLTAFTSMFSQMQQNAAAQSVQMTNIVQALASRGIEVKNDIHVPAAEPPAIHVAPSTATVHVDNHLPASTVNVAAPTVNVAPAAVQVTNEVQPATVAVSVELPDRQTTSIVDRNRDGDIVKVVQTETTLQ